MAARSLGAGIGLVPLSSATVSLMAASSLSIYVLDPGGSVLKPAILDVSAIVTYNSARAIVAKSARRNLNGTERTSGDAQTNDAQGRDCTVERTSRVCV